MERIFLVRFHRLGRNPQASEVTFNAKGADDLAEQVHRHARSRLASKHFEVTIDLAKGKGWIEYGRFGEFDVEDRGPFDQTAVTTDRDAIQSHYEQALAEQKGT